MTSDPSWHRAAAAGRRGLLIVTPDSTTLSAWYLVLSTMFVFIQTVIISNGNKNCTHQTNNWNVDCWGSSSIMTANVFFRLENLFHLLQSCFFSPSVLFRDGGSVPICVHPQPVFSLLHCRKKIKINTADCMQHIATDRGGRRWRGWRRGWGRGSGCRSRGRTCRRSPRVPPAGELQLELCLIYSYSYL